MAGMIAPLRPACIRRSLCALAFIALGYVVPPVLAQEGRKVPDPERFGRLGAQRLPPDPERLGAFLVDPLIVRRPAEATVADPGAVTVTARCNEGELVVGGGYAVDPPSLSSARPVAVEASYPSATDAWTVVAYNLDSLPGGPNAGTTVRAEAYCYVAPDQAVDIRIVATDPVVPSLYAYNDPFTTVTASCPSGHGALSGGFQTEHTRDDIGAMNSWFFGSRPVAAEVVSGWEVTMAPTREPLPETRAYAVCAPQSGSLRFQLGCVVDKRSGTRSCPPTTTAQAVHGPIPSIDQLAYTYYEGGLQCASGEVAIGGGYAFLGSPLIWHQVYQSAGSASPTGWEIGGIYGYQSQDYPSYDPIGADRSSAIEGWVMCARPPEVALLVRINSPTDRTAIGAAPADDVGGGNLVLEAVAISGAGLPRSDVTFEWWIDGAPVATGAVASTSLEVPACKIREHRVEVRATDPSGNTASDSVTVFAGGVC